jgi:hypothetical protein
VSDRPGLEYVIRTFHGNQRLLKLERTHQLMMYVDDKGFYVLGNNIHITVQTTGALLFSAKKVLLEVNNNKLTHMFQSHLHIAERHISDSFKREPKFV